MSNTPNSLNNRERGGIADVNISNSKLHKLEGN